MHWFFASYPPLLFGAAILLAVMAGVARGRTAPGAAGFAWLLWAIALWVGTNGLGFLFTELPPKIWLAKVQYLGIVSIAPLWLFFCLDYTHQGQALTARVRRLLWLFPAVTLLLACTNEWHGLIWSRITLRLQPGFPNTAEFGHGPVFWLAVSYFYALVLCGTAALLWAIVRFPRVYRSQMAALLAAAVLPWLGNLAYLSGAVPFPGFDPTPPCFALAGLCMASAVLRRRMLELAPIARDTLFEFMEDAIVVLDGNGRLVDLNPAAVQLFKMGAPLGHPGAELFAAWPELALLAAQNSPEPQSGEFAFVEADEVRILEARSTAMHSMNHSAGRLLQIRDVTARHRADGEIRRAHEELKTQFAANQELQQQLQELATRDELTGLYNRRYLEETLAREVATAARQNTPLSLILLDIDYFKTINDTYGHAAGDETLRLLGELLVSRTRAGDVACRYGGEEFVVLLPGATSIDALKRAEEIRVAFEASHVRVRDMEIRTTLSLGIAEHPGDWTSGEELLRNADIALYTAKGEGRNVARTFSKLSCPT